MNSRFDLRLLNTLIFFSIKNVFFAPLEIASIPKAPLPEKGSRTVFPVILNWSQLKSVSLVFPEVGRKPVESGKKNFLPLRSPEIILNVFDLIVFFRFKKNKIRV